MKMEVHVNEKFQECKCVNYWLFVLFNDEDTDVDDTNDYDGDDVDVIYHTSTFYVDTVLCLCFNILLTIKPFPSLYWTTTLITLCKLPIFAMTLHRFDTSSVYASKLEH